jgi:endosialidase-like protein
MNLSGPDQTRTNEPEGTDAKRAAEPGQGAPRETRKPYARPRLTVHGRVSKLVLGPSAPSDRNAKEAFEAVEPRAVLAGVVALPIERWSYKGESARHLGPMAQDFAAAFGLGQDDRHIFPLDAAGVALAALQGLHALVQTQGARLETLEREVAALRAVTTALRVELAVREREPVA